jgi:shikimate kinase
MQKERRGRVYLVGFMGSGKSSVGAHLAREIGFRFIDLDHEIEKVRGLPVSGIFEKDGEPEFRRLEANALRLCGAQQGVVVATGGGTLTRRENLEFIRRTGVSVWLDAPLAVMLDRCRDGERRPLLSTPERMTALREAGFGT